MQGLGAIGHFPVQVSNDIPELPLSLFVSVTSLGFDLSTCRYRRLFRLITTLLFAKNGFWCYETFVTQQPNTFYVNRKRWLNTLFWKRMVIKILYILGFADNLIILQHYHANQNVPPKSFHSLCYHPLMLGRLQDFSKLLQWRWLAARN